MPTVQGEFSTREQAVRAADALKATGIPAAHVRIWNIIPEATKPTGAEYGGGSYGGTYGVVALGATVGAVSGAILAGPLGLLIGVVAGGGVGGIAAGASYDGTGLPYPTGARVVVDTSSAAPDAVALLHKMGAAHVR